MRIQLECVLFLQNHGGFRLIAMVNIGKHLTNERKGKKKERRQEKKKDNIVKKLGKHNAISLRESHQ